MTKGKVGKFGWDRVPTRKFNGLVYSLDNWHPRKADAEKQARLMRARGILVRIVKVSDGYEVFVRRA